MKDKTKREKIIIGNQFCVSIYLIGTFVFLFLTFFVNRSLLFLSPTLFLCCIVSGILTDASYTFSSKGSKIAFSVFCFLVLNIYSGVLALQMTEKELETKIDKRKKKKNNKIKKENYVSSPAIMTSEDKKIETIKKYKKLLDDGIITEEEFDKKKKQLLG